MHSPVELYQFTLCPFCNKVRAALDLKGVKYKMIEVNPRTKVELPELPNVAPRKVPVLRIFFAPGRDWPSLSKFPLINPDARHALPGAVFHLSKMRAHGAADARVTSGALYL